MSYYILNGHSAFEEEPGSEPEPMTRREKVILGLGTVVAATAVGLAAHAWLPDGHDDQLRTNHVLESCVQGDLHAPKNNELVVIRARMNGSAYDLADKIHYGKTTLSSLKDEIAPQADSQGEKGVQVGEKYVVLRSLVKESELSGRHAAAVQVPGPIELACAPDQPPVPTPTK